MTLLHVAHVIVLLAAPPLLVGIINRTKSAFAGRRGPPLLQPYHDLVKLLRKGSVYSSTTTWVFRAGPVVGLAVVGIQRHVGPDRHSHVLGRHDPLPDADVLTAHHDPGGHAISAQTLAVLQRWLGDLLA